MKTLILFFLLIAAPASFAVKAPPKPLEERVSKSETVFVGKVINKVIVGDWAHAELEVETALKNSKQGDKVKVVWRVKIGGRPIYDTPEGSRGIAILKDKYKGRYWLRGDMFEDFSVVPSAQLCWGDIS